MSRLVGLRNGRPRRNCERREQGSVTAEFAALVPAVVLVLAVSLGGMQLAARQLQLQDAAALAARSAARDARVDSVIDALVPGASVQLESRGNLVCAKVSMAGTALSSIVGASRLTASSCAIAEGR
ncbi:MAG: hypothetical protein KF801_01440 [Cryobacterium sp.]|jgi:hypothetical protein|nr:hypothetical protein [Cryobacterium sp.]